MTGHFGILRRKAPRRHFLACALLLGLASGSGAARAQTVAVAANAKALIGELSRSYRGSTGREIRAVVASSGVLTAQIRSGAPFDLLLSADTSYPMSLWREGRADTPRVYAFGRLILWTRAAVPLSGGMRALLHPSVRAIAIPNPRNAPYGAAAVEALRASGLYDSVRAKIVYGESVAQVNQYVDTRAAEIGVTASSAPFSGAARGAWAPVDASLYAPIPQGAAVILRSAPDPERAARAFLEFLSTPEAREILRRFGYALP